MSCRRAICKWILVVIASPIALAEPPRDLAPLLKAVSEKMGVPGAAAAVVRNGEIVGVGVAGVRRLGETRAVERVDLVMIGSCGKALTRLLIGRLIDRGALKLDATLAELLPDMVMRDEYKGVTIADLIAHRGGIQPYTEIGPKRTPQLFELTGTPTEQRAAFAKHLLNEPPIAKPGTRFEYSNAGYGLLGHIAERAYGQSYEDALRELVFDPLGMKSAVVDMPNSGPGREGLVGHLREGKDYQPMRQVRKPLPPIVPAGMMSCSIDDFARFAAMLAACEAGKSGNFLKLETAERLREARPGAKGMEGEIFFGGDGFYSAGFALWPSKGVAVVVGTNAGDNDPACEAIIRAVREACAPELQAGGGAVPAAAGEPKHPRYGFTIRAEASGGREAWIVDAVEPGLPAERAGLKAGDRIVEMNGDPLVKIEPEKRSERFRQPELKLTVERDDKRVEVAMKLGG